MNVIELESVSRTFGLGNGATQALREVSLSVPKGQFLIIMGPSGSGKSTLLNILGLLDTQDFGEFKLDGRNTAHLSSRRRAQIRRNHIGFIFQNFNLIGRMNILDNVSLPLLYKGISQTKRYERASEILKYLGIQEKEYYLPSQLSGGQLQRAAIARAMVNRPSIVLADEPTGNLDTKAAKRIMGALKEIHEAGNTIIMVTHNPDLVQYADRVIKMTDGQITEDLMGDEIAKDVKEQKKEAAEMAESPLNEDQAASRSTATGSKESPLTGKKPKDTKKSGRKTKQRRKK